ncbi:PriCT-2 domain-containing protein, partial [Gammaproteobacteria bacterium]|nr:PriCT-2 domain-containing protein [Gammaproteobacteria bacterium]
MVWAVRGLDLPDGEQITRQWSMQSARFTEKGFKAAWDAYDPTHEKPIGIGSVYKLARLFDVRNNESPL